MTSATNRRRRSAELSGVPSAFRLRAIDESTTLRTLCDAQQKQTTEAVLQAKHLTGLCCAHRTQRIGEWRIRANNIFHPTRPPGATVYLHSADLARGRILRTRPANI